MWRLFQRIRLMGMPVDTAILTRAMGTVTVTVTPPRPMPILTEACPLGSTVAHTIAAGSRPVGIMNMAVTTTTAATIAGNPLVSRSKNSEPRSGDAPGLFFHATLFAMPKLPAPRKVKWGVLGVAKIARTKVIPAMRNCERAEVAAIGSRDLSKAQAAAQSLEIPKAYGSYEELLADPEIEAIYNPLPNHLHVAWSTRAARAGKHVLCEKPIALNAQECRTLMEVEKDTGVKIGEAFMVRSHPQWRRVREIVQSGGIGAPRCILSAFSYFNRDPENVRNTASWGGGALMDIGCYPIQVARFVLGAEPRRVLGLMERDPDFRIDRLTSALLEFPSTHVLFTASTQMVPFQTVELLGAHGRIRVEIPFNAPPDRPTRIFIDGTGDLFGSGVETEEFPICDQYTLQADEFSRAIRENTEVPTPLEDSLRNMLAIDALFRSAEQNSWVSLQSEMAVENHVL